jgi:hypothetical protein
MHITTLDDPTRAPGAPRRRAGSAVCAARALALSLVSVGVAACDQGGPTGPAFKSDEPPNAAPNAAMVAAFGGQPKTVFVDPTNGSDAGPGNQAKPFKTLARALGVVSAGDSVQLAAGVYSQATNGEAFSTSGQLVTVPSGVTITGTIQNGVPASTLQGVGNEVGLDLAGDATVRHLNLVGLAVGALATTGQQFFLNVRVTTPAASSVLLPGVGPVSGGIVALGTAKPTVSRGVITVNGTTGVRVAGQAQLAMFSTSTSFLKDGTAVEVAEQAQFTMTSGTIVRNNHLTCLAGTGVSVGDSAAATLRSVAITNVRWAVFATGAPTVHVVGSRITKENKAGCPEFSSVAAPAGAAALSFDSSTVSALGGQTIQDVGIETNERVSLTLNATDITGHQGAGIRLFTTATGLVEAIDAKGGSISGNALGIDAGVPALVHIRVDGTFLVQNKIAVRVVRPILKVRNAFVFLNGTGFQVLGNNIVGKPTRASLGELCTDACVNLGSDADDVGPAWDPGNNNLAANSFTAVSTEGGTNLTQHVHAVGNIWNNNTQGSNGTGLYPARVTIDGNSPLALGQNFRLQSGANHSIRL